MPKLTDEQKQQLKEIFPPMVGDIDPLEHARRVEVLQELRVKLESGEELTAKTIRDVDTSKAKKPREPQDPKTPRV